MKLVQYSDLEIEKTYDFEQKKVTKFLSKHQDLLFEEPIQLIKVALDKINFKIDSLSKAFFIAQVGEAIEAEPMIHTLESESKELIYDCIDLTFFIFQKDSAEVKAHINRIVNYFDTHAI